MINIFPNFGGQYGWMFSYFFEVVARIKVDDISTTGASIYEFWDDFRFYFYFRWNQLHWVRPLAESWIK
jgi:hypothetical protein